MIELRKYILLAQEAQEEYVGAISYLIEYLKNLDDPVIKNKYEKYLQEMENWTFTNWEFDLFEMLDKTFKG